MSANKRKATSINIDDAMMKEYGEYLNESKVVAASGPPLSKHLTTKQTWLVSTFGHLSYKQLVIDQYTATEATIAITNGKTYIKAFRENQTTNKKFNPVTSELFTLIVLVFFQITASSD